MAENTGEKSEFITSIQIIIYNDYGVFFFYHPNPGA